MERLSLSLPPQFSGGSSRNRSPRLSAVPLEAIAMITPATPNETNIWNHDWKYHGLPGLTTTETIRSTPRGTVLGADVHADLRRSAHSASSNRTMQTQPMLCSGMTATTSWSHRQRGSDAGKPSLRRCDRRQSPSDRPRWSLRSGITTCQPAGGIFLGLRTQFTKTLRSGCETW